MKIAVVVLVAALALVGLSAAADFEFGKLNPETGLADPWFNVKDTTTIQATGGVLEPFDINIGTNINYNNKAVARVELDTGAKIDFEGSGFAAVGSEQNVGAYLKIADFTTADGRKQRNALMSTYADYELAYKQGDSTTSLTKFTNEWGSIGKIKAYDLCKDIYMREDNYVNAQTITNDADIKGGYLVAKSGGWASVDEQGSVVKDAVAGSYIGLAQYAWGELDLDCPPYIQNEGSYKQRVTLDNQDVQDPSGWGTWFGGINNY